MEIKVHWLKIHWIDSVSVKNKLSWPLISSSVDKQSTGDTNAMFEQNVQQTPRVITYQYAVEVQDTLATFEKSNLGYGYVITSIVDCVI